MLDASLDGDYPMWEYCVNYAVIINDNYPIVKLSKFKSTK